MSIQREFPKLLAPEQCGASQLACTIVNNTFLSLDGFAAMRKQMEGTEYTAQHFGAELARIVDRELKDVTGSLKALLDWGRDQHDAWYRFQLQNEFRDSDA